jgi:TonB-linked SusC/RagA family outer membrane protein
MKKILLMLLTLCMSINIYAQTSITGKVIDEKGDPLIGASVKIKNDKIGTVTDVNGNFSLKSNSGVTLSISYVGYNSTEVQVTDYKPLTIKLVPNSNSDLNEVVVIGYGTTKKVTLTGSVAQVSNADIETTKNEDIVNDLAGKLPGLRIQQNTAEPGSYNNTYDIRGYSYSGNGTATPPLVIIDGVPQGVDVLQRLDPADVESISVLKDASAAVYGVQAANGVILVTTKKGKKGQLSITYTVTGTDQVINKQPQEASAVQWMTLTNEMSMHNINGPTLIFQPSLIAQYQNGTQQGTNWIAATMNKSASEFNHSITASGGSDNTTYFLSFGYLTQNGFFTTNDENYQKYNFRSNIESKITKRLTLGVQIAGLSDVQNTPSVADWNIILTTYRNAPINPVYLNNDPTLPANPGYNNYGGANSVSMITPSQSGYGLNQNKKFQGGATLTYDVPYIDGLKAKAFFNYNYNTQDNKTYNRVYTNYNPGSTAGTYVAIGGGGQNGQSYVQDYYNSGYTSFLQYSLDYNHTFGKSHNIEALVLYEQQSSNGNQFTGFRYETLNSDQLGAGSTTNQTVTSAPVNPSALESYVGKLHYDYQSKYLVDFTIRRDGSSLFPPAKQFGLFPAVQAAYRLSEESFFKKITQLSFIDNFKIRGSYGVMGDASGASGYNFVGGYNYPITSGVSAQNLPAGSVFDGNFVNGLGFRGLTNPVITWYTAHTFDVGVDIDMWKGLFEVTADYFNRNRYGLLGTELLSLPGSVGAGLPQVNLNSDQTRGYELSITNNDRIGQVGLRISGNVSYTRTKWLTYVKAPQGSTYADWLNNGSLNGRNNDVWFGYGYGGQFQSFSQIRGYNVNQGGGNRSVVPGDYIYQDWNHDGYFDSGDLHPIAATYNAQIGNSLSSYQPALINFGLSLGANYKGFDINAVLQGAADKWIQLPLYYSYPLDHSGNTFSEFANDWHPADPTANPFNPNTVYVPGQYAYTGTNINQSALAPGAIVNASYVRLKSLELGYTFPNRWTKKVIRSLRVFVNGYNLLTLDGKGLNGIDPEHPTDLNATQYPLDHTFSAGINAKF